MVKRSKKPFLNCEEDKERKVKEEWEEESQVDEEDLAIDVKEINFQNGAMIDVRVGLIDKLNIW